MTHPFRIAPSEDRSPVSRSLIKAARPAMELAMRLPALNDLYDNIIAHDPGQERHFADKALEVMRIVLDLNEETLEAIPKEGPLVVVANHPFGGIEGIILASLLRRVRPDVKLLANEMLSCIPELRDTFFFVDVFGEDAQAKRLNAAAIRQSMSWVGDGHALGVFPSGAVSHLTLRQRNVADPPWQSATARIIQRTGATVVPVFFDGRNSNLFQIAGFVHPTLRSAMLPHELLKRRRSRVPMVIGAPIPPERTSKLEGREQLTNYLRVRTYLLRPRHRQIDLSARPDDSKYAPIIPPESPEVLAEEIGALPPQQTLMQSGEYDVLYARRPQMSALLREIGRLREITFRQVGEGSGKACDLDRFDDHYLHLLVWNRNTAEIVGSYRMGPTDEILPSLGVKGLYTSTLFNFRKKLIKQVTPALELGRSFVHPDYQRSYQPLQLLWKGIAAYAALHPRYRHLFGPVSISANYTSMSKNLLMTFLQLHRFLPNLASQIRPKNPPSRRRTRDWDRAAFSTVASNLEEVGHLVREIEADGKPMPVLLRQYLKLNAQFLGFNVDPEFGNVLDGLMLIDIPNMPKALGKRYFGAEAWDAYRKHHGVTE
ncbi:lysophospholipid acyltransferase family protein [Algisphaera agarilytica]|uniref:Putative hemolysin n=1 Tax=Algisphaera agarilytica TaxID=1385975 RepID=A0A7X0HAT5_9BACT|nr:GNAT family N-acyltransferase [Algisphaera agarilytica]MBB6431301.1 putative hemolysin [Algisphaera agarilytica]